MKVNIFSPIIIILIIALSIKAVTLIDRVQEQTVPDNYTSSVLIDSAYAKNENTSASIKDAKDLDVPRKSASQQTKQHLNESVPAQPNAEQDAKNNVTANILKETQLQNLSDKDNVANISNAELALLKELSQRRQQLDKAEEALSVREQILKVTEARLEQKISELKLRQIKLEEFMKQYDQKEQGKILSLVKIYENMKPREAAKIFDELEMPILLEVVSKMKEIKVAPVIASMNPIKARDLSIEMAKVKTIN
jgi:flagellar motility protein MotE (MotC chaperone)